MCLYINRGARASIAQFLDMSFRTISVCFSIVWAVIVTSTAASVIDHNLFPDLYEQFLDNRSEYRVVLLRHGETDDNAANHYSGWYDTQLTVKGKWRPFTSNSTRTYFNQMVPIHFSKALNKLKSLVKYLTNGI